MNKLYVLIGIAGSGKSSWSSMVMSREDVKLVSSDAMSYMVMREFKGILLKYLKLYIIELKTT